MPKWVIFSLIIAGILPAAVFAKATPPETLTRSGKWIVDYDNEGCHLITEFGTGKEKLIMRLSRYSLGDEFNLNLFGSKAATSDVNVKAKLDFGLSDKPIEVIGLKGTAGNLKAMLFSPARLDGWRSPSPEAIAPTISPEQEASVSGVTVDLPRKPSFRLEFGSLGKPMAQLRSCQAALVSSWGYDPAVQKALSRPIIPSNDASDWMRDSDYPLEAIIRGVNGLVELRLEVDEAGKLAGCHVLNRTKPDVFSDLACRSIAQRAKFEPALDVNGKPVRSFAIFHVRWVMPT